MQEAAETPKTPNLLEANVVKNNKILPIKSLNNNSKCRNCLRHLWAWRNFVVFVTAPFALSPLIIFFENDKELKEPMRCAYVLAIMVVYWVSEAIPIGITSLIPMVAFPLLQLQKSTDLAPLYIDETNMAIVASILVVKAFEDAELHKQFAFGVIRVVGVQPRWLLAGLMSLSWCLSMVLSNAMAATLIIPVVLEIISELRLAIRTTTNKNFASSHTSSVFARVTAVTDGLASAQALRMARDLENMLVLAVAYSCSIGGTATLMGTAENLIIREEVDNLYEEHHCPHANPISFGSWVIWGLPAAVLFLPLAWLWILLYYTGFRYAFGLKQGAPNYINQHKDQLYAVIQQMHAKIPRLGARQVIVLIHLAAMILMFFTRVLHTQPPFGWEILAPGYVRESTAACFVAISLFAFPISLVKKNDATEKLRPPKNAIKWSEQDGGRAFNIVLLIGGGLAASHVAISSGFAKVVSDVLFEAIHNLSPKVAVICLVIFSVFLTELVSNAASVHFMLPILSELSEKQDYNPLLYMLPTALTSSFAFMLPVATPPNAVAYSLTKGLHVIDMVGIGFIMNMIGISIVLLATNTWGSVHFQFYNPAWTEIANNTYICHSIWNQNYNYNNNTNSSYHLLQTSSSSSGHH